MSGRPRKKVWDVPLEVSPDGVIHIPMMYSVSLSSSGKKLYRSFISVGSSLSECYAPVRKSKGGQFVEVSEDAYLENRQYYYPMVKGRTLLLAEVELPSHKVTLYYLKTELVEKSGIRLSCVRPVDTEEDLQWLHDRFIKGGRKGLVMLSSVETEAVTLAYQNGSDGAVPAAETAASTTDRAKVEVDLSSLDELFQGEDLGFSGEFD